MQKSAHIIHGDLWAFQEQAKHNSSCRDGPRLSLVYVLARLLEVYSQTHIFRWPKRPNIINKTYLWPNNELTHNTHG